MRFFTSGFQQDQKKKKRKKETKWQGAVLQQQQQKKGIPNLQRYYFNYFESLYDKTEQAVFFSTNSHFT